MGMKSEVITKKYRQACYNVVRKLKRQGVKIKHTSIWSAPLLGKNFDILLEFAPGKSFPEVEGDIQPNFYWSDVEDYIKSRLDLGAYIYNIQTGGLPVYDVDRSSLFVVPETRKKFMDNPNVKRVMLEHPIPLEEFRKNAVAILKRCPFKKFGVLAHYYLENTQEYIKSTWRWVSDTYLKGTSDTVYMDGFIFEWE